LQDVVSWGNAMILSIPMLNRTDDAVEELTGKIVRYDDLGNL
jgi:hypothetical protein